MARKLVITALIIIGAFALAEFLAPGHWEFFTEYVEKTYTSFTVNVKTLT